ncbi:MAG: molybdenum cofactor biosynthesis protein MoaE [Desulfurococcales archaeon]|nr:molybdenum cofactor biosynthesis protein MoaE [Desulfurococcales archaeon]
MRIKVRLYSIISELVGKREVSINVRDGANLQELFRYLSDNYAGFLEAIRILGKDNIIVLDDRGRRLSWSDNVKSTLVHVMPPPEGGNVAVIETGILAKGETIDLNRLVENAITSSDSTGAIAVFVGSVRSDNFGKSVKKLVYEDAGKLTALKLREIAREVLEKYKLSYLAAYHYVGELEPGDLTMIVVVASRSRKEAFPAMEELVESMKRKLPIWKKEVYDDGSYSYILGGKPYSVKS